MTANKYIKEVEVKYKNKAPIKKIKITGSEQIFKLFKDLQDETQEKFIALHLAGDNSISCFQVVYIGTTNAALVNPADILRTTLLTGACGLIVVHNHPSGNPDPSRADKQITEMIDKACKIFGIKLYDHIIIGESYFSFADNDMIQK